MQRFDRTIPRVRRTGRAAACALLALIAVMSAGCSDDSTSAVLIEICAEFVPEPVVGSPEVVARDGAGSTCNNPQVEIVATGVSGVWAANMEIAYDVTTISYQGLEIFDSHMGWDGTIPVVILPTGDSGLITIGITRDESQSTDTVTFNGEVLVRLFFTRRGNQPGMFPMTFSVGEFLDNSEQPQPIATDPWVGGNFVIN